MDDSFPYIVILICLLFSALFSGMEIAFISVDKLHLEIIKKKGKISGKILSIFTRCQTQFLATMLVGNNITLVLYGIIMAAILEPWIVVMLPEMIQSNVVLLIIQSILSAILVLIVAEFLPKSLFLLNPNLTLRFFAVPIYIIFIIMYPLVFVIMKVSSGIIHLMGYEITDTRPVFGLVDLNNFIKKNLLTQSKENGVNTKILNNVMDFKTIKVRECMIPRTEIIAIDTNSSISELTKKFIDTGFSKVIIHNDSIDDVIGYCHAIELFKKPKNISSILTPLPIVPETMWAKDLLIQFIQERKSIALIVDEYGGTSGIVTMEDIIEEIFGEIQDEHDDEYLIEDQVDENNFLFSARHEIDYLNEKYKLDLPVAEYDTLGGLIFEYYKDIPKINEVVKILSFEFTIVSMEKNRIDKVKLTKLKNDEG